MKITKRITALFLTAVLLFSIAGGVVAEEFDDYTTGRRFCGTYGKINITLKNSGNYTTSDFSYVPASLVVQNSPRSITVYIGIKAKSYTDLAVNSIKKVMGDDIDYITLDYECEYVSSGDVAGDATGDYILNLADVTHVLKYIAGWDVPIFYAANMNYDNYITLYDATCILKVIAGWNEDNIYLKKPSDELIQQIESDYNVYYNRKPDSDPVYVKYYYGTYNGAVPVLIDGPFSYSEVIVNEEVAGSVFCYPNTHYIKVWKDGEFFPVKEAFENGYLTKKDIATIAELYNSNAGIKYPTPDCYLPSK